MRFLLSVALLFLVAFVFDNVDAHPQRYKDLKKSNLAPGQVPPFRSFHVHFLFEKRRSSDTCTGYDDAMRLKAKFEDYFHVTPNECQADFDVGELCMFPPAMNAFGPFPVPEMAAFVPLNRFNDVVQWTMQNRGAITAFIHPNSGYEREDHSTWAIWAGQQRPLDLSDYEFSEQLDPLFNTSCRDEPAYYPFPTPNSPLSPTKAHVRIISQLLNSDVTVTVTIDGTPSSFPTVSNLDQTWYSDVNPSASSSSTFCATFTSSSGSLDSCVTIKTLSADSFHTLVAWNGTTLFHYDDINYIAENESSVRVINLLGAGASIGVKRDGNLLSLNWLKLGDASDYDSPTANAQHLYEIIDGHSFRTLTNEPYYTNAGQVVTILVLGGLPSQPNPTMSTIMLFDYPHDSPLGRSHAYNTME